LIIKDVKGNLKKSFVSDSAFDCSYPAIIWNGKSWVIAYESVKDAQQLIQVVEK
jgi:hypothetical protein